MKDPLRMRLDQALVYRGLVRSRTVARNLISTGHVHYDRKLTLKPAVLIDPSKCIEIKGQLHPWASRGGIKLDAALDYFSVNPVERTCIDVGASTGGFTDVLLQRGASSVYSIDVGHDQLLKRLINDVRVVNFEKTDARSLSKTLITKEIDIAVCDVSFISVLKVAKPIMRLIKPGGCFICLIKPQFEVGPEFVGKGGIVKDSKLINSVVRERMDWFNKSIGWTCRESMVSPIKGKSGNVEFFVKCERISL